MRLRLLIAGLSTVLFLSGWGGLCASAVCRAASPSAGATDEHACCRMKASASSAHCSSTKERASFVESARAVSLAPEACEHCFVRSENPPARFALPEPHARKRTDSHVGPGIPNASDAPRTDFRPPPSVLRHGAPPGASATALHVLNSVYLI